ncbi:hypothetical protein Tco_1270520 [Tanacetum coccineum]
MHLVCALSIQLDLVDTDPSRSRVPVCSPIVIYTSRSIVATNNVLVLKSRDQRGTFQAIKLFNPRDICQWLLIKLTNSAQSCTQENIPPVTVLIPLDRFQTLGNNSAYKLSPLKHELAVTANTKGLFDGMLVYCDRENAKDLKFANGLHNLWVELLERSNERQPFITELEGLCPSVKRYKILECLNDDQRQDFNQLLELRKAHLEKKWTRLRTCTKNHQEVLFLERGDDVAGIKQRRRDLSGDSVWILVMASQHSQLKVDLEPSTWRRH